MLMDSRNLFVDSLDLSGANITTSATDSTYYIDLGAAGDADEELYLIVSVGGTALGASGGTATLDIAIVTDSATGFATAPVTLASKTGITEASCTAGAVLWSLRLPRGLKRYVKLTFTAGTTLFDSGILDAFLTKKPQTADFSS